MLCVLFVPVVCAERGCDDAVIIIKISVCIVFIAVAYCDGRFDLAAVYNDRGAAFKPSFGWVENPVFAGEDRIFHPAEAWLKGRSTVIVHSGEVKAPIAVRYCYKNYAYGNLYNNYGIVAPPFRTDDWNE